jgi:hypothetical protein
MSPPRLWPPTDCTTNYRPVLSSESPRVEAGRNTSTAVPASRKRRRKGNPVVSDETVMYGYESSATLTTDRLHCILETRPLVREGAPRRRAKNFPAEEKKKKHVAMGPKGVPDTKMDRPTDRRSKHQLNYTPVHNQACPFRCHESTACIYHLQRSSVCPPSCHPLKISWSEIYNPFHTQCSCLIVN